MSKDSIQENEAIQNGLEKFLEQELDLSLTDAGSEPGIKEDLFPSEPQTVFHSAEKAPGANTRKASEASRKAPHRTPPKKSDYYDDYEEDMVRPPKPRREKPASPKPAKRKPPKMTKKDLKKQKKARKQNKRRGNKNEKNPKSKFKKVLTVIIVLLIAFSILWYFIVGSMYQKMTHEKADELSRGALNKDGVTNVLLIGNDSRENGEDGRSDAMILLSISKNTKTIHMTSLLRDMYVDIPGHDGNRLNAAYSYGGPTLLCQTIEQNLGIDVNRYVLVNFQAFANLVDAVGGVDLELSNEEVQWVNAYLNEYNLLEGKEMTTDYLDTSLSGEIHLNGPQSLAYSRNRYIGTDFGRTERQRKVLSQVIKKMPLAMVGNSKEVVDGLFPNLTTNLSQFECYRLSFNASKFLTYDIEQSTIPAEGTYSNATIRDMAVLQVDFDANKEIWEQEIYGENK